MIYRFLEFTPRINASAFIAPNATIIGRVHIEENASIWFNTVVRADINEISVGANSNIQDNCLFHVTHEEKVSVGERVTVGHGVILHGCTIESDCLIGMGSIILDGAVVGAQSVIAAGALVAPGARIPEGSLVMGMPGKVVRPVSEDERLRFKQNWQGYVVYSSQYNNPDIF